MHSYGLQILYRFQDLLSAKDRHSGMDRVHLICRGKLDKQLCAGMSKMGHIPETLEVALYNCCSVLSFPQKFVVRQYVDCPLCVLSSLGKCRKASSSLALVC